MKNTNKRYLTKITVPKNQHKNPEVLRVILHKDFTQVDFGYVAPWIYIKGGWIHIAPYSHLRVQGTENRYKLLEAQHIAIAPEQHHFESNEDWKVFTLIFEPIPIEECIIDIIEEENPDENDFNVYGIQLAEVKAISLFD